MWHCDSYTRICFGRDVLITEPSAPVRGSAVLVLDVEDVEDEDDELVELVLGTCEGFMHGAIFSLGSAPACCIGSVAWWLVSLHSDRITHLTHGGWGGCMKRGWQWML